MEENVEVAIGYLCNAINILYGELCALKKEQA